MSAAPVCCRRGDDETLSGDDSSDTSRDTPEWVDDWFASPARSPSSYDHDSNMVSPHSPSDVTPRIQRQERGKSHERQACIDTWPARSCALTSTCDGNESLLHLLPSVCECATTLRKVCRFYMQLNAHFRNQAEEHARERHELAASHQRQIGGLLQLMRSSPDFISLVTEDLHTTTDAECHNGTNKRYAGTCTPISHTPSAMYLAHASYSAEDMVLLRSSYVQPTRRRLEREMTALRERCRVHATALESELQVSMRAAILTALRTHCHTHQTALHCTAREPVEPSDNLGTCAVHATPADMSSCVLSCVAEIEVPGADGGTGVSVSMAFVLSPLAQLSSLLLDCCEGYAEQAMVEKAVTRHLTRLAEARHAMLVVFGTREQARDLVELPHTPELLLGSTGRVFCAPRGSDVVGSSADDGGEEEEEQQNEQEGQDATDMFEPLPRHLYRSPAEEEEEFLFGGRDGADWSVFVSRSTRMSAADIVVVCEPPPPSSLRCADETADGEGRARSVPACDDRHLPAGECEANDWKERCNAASSGGVSPPTPTRRESVRRPASEPPDGRDRVEEQGELATHRRGGRAARVPVSLLSAVLNLAAGWQVDTISIAVLDASPRRACTDAAINTTTADTPSPLRLSRGAAKSVDANRLGAVAHDSDHHHNIDDASRLCAASAVTADCRWCAPVLRALHRAMSLFLRRRSEAEECVTLGYEVNALFDETWRAEERATVYAGRVDPRRLTRADAMSLLSTHTVAAPSCGAHTVALATNRVTARSGEAHHGPSDEDGRARRSESRSRPTEEEDKGVVAQLRRRLLGYASARPKLLENIISQGSKPAPHAHRSAEETDWHDTGTASRRTNATQVGTGTSSSVLTGLPFAIRVFLPIAPHAFAASGSHDKPAVARARQADVRRVDLPLATPAGIFSSPFALLRRDAAPLAVGGRRRGGDTAVRQQTRVVERDVTVLRDILDTALEGRQNYRLWRESVRSSPTE